MVTETWIVTVTFPANTPRGTAVAAKVQRSQFEPPLDGIFVNRGFIKRIYTITASPAKAVLVISKGNRSVSLNQPEDALLITQNNPAGFVSINLEGGFYTFSAVNQVAVGSSAVTATFYLEVEVF
jgi:hypothetical protein